MFFHSFLNSSKEEQKNLNLKDTQQFKKTSKMSARLLNFVLNAEPANKVNYKLT